MGETIILPPKSGSAFALSKGHAVMIICLDGEQVADMTAYNSRNLQECLSNKRTYDFEQSLRLTMGNTLYSNQGKPMLRIIKDTCGVHDFLLAPCCKDIGMEQVDNVNGQTECLNNLYTALQKYEIGNCAVPTAFNVFLNVEINPGYDLKIAPPAAEPGDHIILLAEMDLIIGITACASENANNNDCKPIAYQILEDPTA